jgi:hypothetical protein
MGISDRDYMRPEFRARRKKKGKTGLLAKLKFFLWQLRRRMFRA